MPEPTLAALESALAEGTLEAWLTLLPLETTRRVRHALTLDRGLVREHPGSLATCLLARTRSIEELDEVRDAWEAELDARGAPWIRTLRGPPFPELPLAELHAGAGFSFKGLTELRFVSDEVVTMEPSSGGASPARGDRLVWSWRAGQHHLEPCPGDRPKPASDPRFEVDASGAVWLVRSPGAPRVALPREEYNNAKAARFSHDGRRIFIYGEVDFFDGFLAVLDSATLAVERRLYVDGKVIRVDEHDHGNLLVLHTTRGTSFVRGDEFRRFRPPDHYGCLSPNGELCVTFDDCLRVWPSAPWTHDPSLDGRFPTTFDPTGRRVLSGRRLFDARTGALVADLGARFSRYLEGGPGEPWFHLGERFLVTIQSSLQVWDIESGQAGETEPLQFPQWYSLAYDRAGTRLAALHLRRSPRPVNLHELPSGRRLTTIHFDVDAVTLAMSGDGLLLAAGGGRTVEVRSSSGELVRRLSLTPAGDAEDGYAEALPSLRFSADGRHLMIFGRKDGCTIWDLESGSERRAPDYATDSAIPGSPVPAPPDWEIERGKTTSFLHRPTGTRLVLPFSGPWVTNPAETRYLASDDLHVELRAP